ncbi:MAG TPA: hypothetical protein VNH15_01825 [Elusimicrobiota bacterium]|nr:hypothetical protein [Elusimicrobiota bacterium]
MALPALARAYSFTLENAQDKLNMTTEQIARQNPAALARKILQEQGITPQNIQAKMKAHYQFQRVEVTGWHSDDNDGFQPKKYGGPPNSFDYPIRISNLGSYKPPKPVKPSVSLSYIKYLGAAATYHLRYSLTLHQDTTESMQDIQHDGISKRAAAALSPLRGKEINQIVCHSWGSAAVYNAIMTNEIRPPNVIFVLGSPSNDKDEWEMLSKYTGTKVYWLRSKDDYFIKAVAWKSSDHTPPSKEQIEDQWIEWRIGCRPKDCMAPSAYYKYKNDLLADQWDDGGEEARNDPTNVYPGGFYANGHFGSSGHERLGYYKTLFATRALAPLLQGTDQLKAAQIARDEADTWAAAETRAQNLIADAKDELQNNSSSDGCESSGSVDLNDPSSVEDATHPCIPSAALKPPPQSLPAMKPAMRAPPPHVVAPVPMRPLPPTQEELNSYIAYYESYAQWDRNVAINVCKGQPLSDQDANSYVQNYILLSQYLTKYPSETGGYQFPKNMDDMRDGLSGCALEAMDDFISVADGYYNGHWIDDPIQRMQNYAAQIRDKYGLNPPPPPQQYYQNTPHFHRRPSPPPPPYKPFNIAPLPPWHPDPPQQRNCSGPACGQAKHIHDHGKGFDGEDGQ